MNQGITNRAGVGDVSDTTMMMKAGEVALVVACECLGKAGPTYSGLVSRPQCQTCGGKGYAELTREDSLAEMKKHVSELVVVPRALGKVPQP